MDQSYKQLFTELLAKVVSLEVEKKQLEEKNKQLQVEVESLKEKFKQTPEKSPLEKTIDEIEKACPGLLPKNSLGKINDEMAKNYPNLFKAEKENPKQTPEKSPLENMLDEIEKAYPGLIQTSENKKTSEDETVYHVDIADLGKKFVRVFMGSLMDELDPKPL